MNVYWLVLVIVGAVVVAIVWLAFGEAQKNEREAVREHELKLAELEKDMFEASLASKPRGIFQHPVRVPNLLGRSGNKVSNDVEKLILGEGAAAAQAEQEQTMKPMQGHKDAEPVLGRVEVGQEFPGGGEPEERVVADEMLLPRAEEIKPEDL